LQVSGAASVTAVGVGQRIEQLNSYDLAGSTCTLSVNISNSLLTTVTWTASYATSADTWSAKTQIATGTFTVTSTLTNYSVQISVPAAATTGIEILFTVGAQTSGTWVIGNAQLEKGTVASSFDFRPYGTELGLCQRYALAITSACFFATGMLRTSGTNSYLFAPTPFPLRATPTSNLAASSYTIFSGDSSAAISAISVGATTGSGFYLNTTNPSVGAVGSGAMLYNPSSTAVWSAEL
jgi:hypothetical protein